MLPAAVNSSSADIAANRLFTAPDAGLTQSASIGGPIPETPQGSEVMPPFDDGSLPDMVYRLLPERRGDGVFEFESVNFSLLPYVVTYDPDYLMGERVRMVGFVHKEKGWPENSFVLGRLSIWCCTADASLVGMWISLKDNAPPAGTWLEVEGTVDIVDRLEFDDRSMERVPALKDVSLRKVPQPKEEYTLAPAW
jgi:putative membrane protein